MKKAKFPVHNPRPQYVKSVTSPSGTESSPTEISVDVVVSCNAQNQSNLAVKLIVLVDDELTNRII